MRVKCEGVPKINLQKFKGEKFGGIDRSFFRIRTILEQSKGSEWQVR